MGFPGLFKKRPPDFRTLGKWLWNNDVALAEQTLRNASVVLFQNLCESGVIAAACGEGFSEDDTFTIAGHLTNLLDGGSLMKGYAPKAQDPRLLSAAEATRDLLLGGEYPQLSALSVMAGTLLAINLWYGRRFPECGLVTDQLISTAVGKRSGEAYRVRGFAYFAQGDFAQALADILEAKRIEPGLVGLNEPLKALSELTKTRDASDARHEPAGIEKMRETLRTLSAILKVADRAIPRESNSEHPLFDFAARLHDADRLDTSGALTRPQTQLGDVVDLAQCAMSAQISLTQYLLADPSTKRSDLPPPPDIRDAFGYCLLFLHGTASINKNVDPAFAGAVEDFERQVDVLFARLDESKFDLP